MNFPWTYSPFNFCTTLYTFNSNTFSKNGETVVVVINVDIDTTVFSPFVF
jgi:hypothetical protein